MKKPAVKIILLFLVILLCPGCLGGRELSELEIVIGIGIDSTESPDSILLTAQVVDVNQLGLSGNGGGGKEKKAYWNVSFAGETIYEAVRQMTHKTANRIFLPHCQVVIYGRDVAEKGLYKHFDFFVRSLELRLTSFVLIARDRAGDVLDAKPQTEDLPAINIHNLVKSYGFTSHLYDVTLKEFTSRLISEHTSPIAPIISVTGEGDNKDILISGLAVFNDDKMVGELDMDETRGLLWVINKVKSGVLLVPTPENTGIAAFEIESAKGKVRPEITDEGKIIMHIDINLKANLSEHTSVEEISNIETFELLQDGISEVVVSEITAAYEKSAKTSSDIFGFNELLQKKYKKMWPEYKDIWDEVYKNIKLDISVQSKITKTNLIKKPVTQKVKGD